MSEPSVEDGESPKQAACLRCRKSKMKCIRDEGEAGCKKCLSKGAECIVPEYHIGRHKGAKNKRTGLEKAVHQLEQAIRESKKRDTPDGGPSVSDLEDLLRTTESIVPRQRSETVNGDLIPHADVQSSASRSQHGSTSDEHTRYKFRRHDASEQERLETHNLSVNDAENPLQLLAQTSELLLTPRQLNSGANGSATSYGRNEYWRTGDPVQPLPFFSRFRCRLDNEPSMDPIEIGLVTMQEAEVLFTFFHEQLSHTRWGLDAYLHTPSFVRSRSNFLFTSVLSAAALFMPAAAAMSRRLLSHCRKLALYVLEKRKCSVEIVLAFMIGIPWMTFGDHWADDETCAHLSMALSIALDLSMNKVITGVPNTFAHRRIARADCLDARRALDTDDFPAVDATSQFGRRLLRRRERVWLALFVLERGVCLARGRSFTLPMAPLVEHCDRWHESDLADKWDGNLVSIAVLRRGLSILIDSIRRACDSHELTGAMSTTIVDEIHHDIESFFNDWFATWPDRISEQHQLPPYVDILVSHTRLSTYSSVINHPSAPLEVKHFFHAAGLSAALNVMRAAVQGEGRLKSMPNNTAIMISFAACIALRLSTMGDEARFPLAPSVRNLIEETADVLERVGGTPAHRKGASVIFAQQLRRIISVKPVVSNSLPMTSSEPMQEHYAAGLPRQNDVNQMQAQHLPFSTEPIAFSGMSNNQIIETVNNAGLGFEQSWADFQFDDSAGLDWLEWPAQ